MFGLKEGEPGTWAPLSLLTALTGLQLGSEERLPAQLAACTALADLKFGEVWGLGGEGGQGA